MKDIAQFVFAYTSLDFEIRKNDSWAQTIFVKGKPVEMGVLLLPKNWDLSVESFTVSFLENIRDTYIKRGKLYSFVIVIYEDNLEKFTKTLNDTFPLSAVTLLNNDPFNAEEVTETIRYLEVGTRARLELNSGVVLQGKLIPYKLTLDSLSQVEEKLDHNVKNFRSRVVNSATVNLKSILVDLRAWHKFLRPVVAIRDFPPHLNTKINSGYYQFRFLISIMILCIAIGTLYSLAAGTRDAAIAVVMLCIGTFVLMIGVRFAHKFIIDQGKFFFPNVMNNEKDEIIKSATRDFHNRMFDTRNSFRWGLRWSLVVPTAILFMQTDKQNQGGIVAVLLFIFLFFVNLMTGAAFYGAMKLFQQIKEVGNSIDFDFQRRDNSSTQFVLSMGTRLGSLASFYSSICLLSVFFLHVPLQLLVAGYSIFAPTIALGFYVILTRPLRKKFVLKRTLVLDRLDNQIYDIQIEHNKSNRVSPETEDLYQKELESLKKQLSEAQRGAHWPYSFRALIPIGFMLVVSFFPLIFALVTALFRQ
jgi:hypothetical protein